MQNLPLVTFRAQTLIAILLAISISACGGGSKGTQSSSAQSAATSSKKSEPSSDSSSSTQSSVASSSSENSVVSSSSASSLPDVILPNGCRIKSSPLAALKDLNACPGTAIPEEFSTYKIIGTTLYYDDFPLHGVNACNVEFLSRDFIRSNNTIYAGSQKILKIDAATFQVIDDRFARDKDRIYYYYPGYGGPKTLSHDAANFLRLNRLYSKDSFNVYWGENIILGADPETFVEISEYLAKDKNTVYFSRYSSNLDADTTISLGNGFYTDGNDVYFYEVKTTIPAAEFINIGFGYAKSHSAIFNGSVQILAPMDLNTAKAVSSSYLTDGIKFYYNSSSNIPKEMIGVDIETFKHTENAHAKDKNHVYAGSKPLEWADPATFERVNAGYIKDKNNVYASGRKLENVDIETFEIEYFYGKDKNNVYYFDEIIECADPSTFEYLGRNVSRDANYVYREKYKLDLLDPSSIKVYDYSISRDKNHVFDDFTLIPEVNSENFVYVAEESFHDGNSFYFRDRVIPGVDLSSPITAFSEGWFFKSKTQVFGRRVLAEIDAPTFNQLNFSFGKTFYSDKDFVYSESLSPVSADVENFSVAAEYVTSGDVYFKDSSKVFFNSSGWIRELVGADPATFQHLNQQYSRDESKLFINEKELVGINPDSAKNIGAGILADNISVYWGLNKLIDADPETFIKISNSHAVDANNVYCKTKKLEGISATNYSKVGDYIAGSGKTYYGCTEITTIDNATFEIVGHYIKDKNNVYLNGTVLTDSDAATFTGYANSGNYYKDKNYVYTFSGEKVEGADVDTFTPPY